MKKLGFGAGLIAVGMLLVILAGCDGGVAADDQPARLSCFRVVATLGSFTY